MRHLYFFFLLLLFVSCSKDHMQESSRTNLLELEIANQKFSFTGDKFGINENCNRIYLGASTSVQPSETNFLFKMALSKNGSIEDILFVDYSDNNRHYKSADFISSEVFLINNFTFDRSSRIFELEFTGILYEINYPQNKKTISGKVKTENLKEVDCGFVAWDITAFINDKPFDGINIFSSYIESETWTAFSDNGLRIKIDTETKLKTMPVGTYEFNKDNSQNRVSLEKYIGQFKASNGLRDPKEWETYDCEGTLTIEEHGKKSTEGSFSFKAYKDGLIIYEVINGRFVL